MDYKRKIRDIRDFPQEGVIFRDIAPLLEDKAYFISAINVLANKIEGTKIDKIVGIDARGFIIAGALAYKLKCGLVMLRKKGKLPYETESIDYDLEYNRNSLEIHRDSICPGEKILIVDDVLATGGTVGAAIKLVDRLKGQIVGLAFVVELSYLKGVKSLSGYPINSLVKYNE